MRKIQTQDVFKLSRIIKTADLKSTIIEYVKEGKRISNGSTPDEIKEAQENLGVEVFMSIIEACAEPKLEEQFYYLLAGIFETEESKVKEMSLDSLIEHLKQAAEENNLINFFATAAKLALK